MSHTIPDEWILNEPDQKSLSGSKADTDTDSDSPLPLRNVEPKELPIIKLHQDIVKFMDQMFSEINEIHNLGNSSVKVFGGMIPINGEHPRISETLFAYLSLLYDALQHRKHTSPLSSSSLPIFRTPSIQHSHKSVNKVTNTHSPETKIDTLPNTNNNNNNKKKKKNKTINKTNQPSDNNDRTLAIVPAKPNASSTTTTKNASQRPSSSSSSSLLMDLTMSVASKLTSSSSKPDQVYVSSLDMALSNAAQALGLASAAQLSPQDRVHVKLLLVMASCRLKIFDFLGDWNQILALVLWLITLDRRLNPALPGQYSIAQRSDLLPSLLSMAKLAERVHAPILTRELIPFIPITFYFLSLAIAFYKYERCGICWNHEHICELWEAGVVCWNCAMEHQYVMTAKQLRLYIRDNYPQLQVQKSQQKISAFLATMVNRSKDKGRGKGTHGRFYNRRHVDECLQALTHNRSFDHINPIHRKSGHNIPSCMTLAPVSYLLSETIATPDLTHQNIPLHQPTHQTSTTTTTTTTTSSSSSSSSNDDLLALAHQNTRRREFPLQPHEAPPAKKRKTHHDKDNNPKTTSCYTNIMPVTTTQTSLALSMIPVTMNPTGQPISNRCLEIILEQYHYLPDIMALREEILEKTQKLYALVKEANLYSLQFEANRYGNCFYCNFPFDVEEPPRICQGFANRQHNPIPFHESCMKEFVREVSKDWSDSNQYVTLCAICGPRKRNDLWGQGWILSKLLNNDDVYGFNDADADD
jgi:hypothetical protein